jgi:hypothetical protein
MKLKKKSSPLKLLSQSQPNLLRLSLGASFHQSFVAIGQVVSEEKIVM